MDNPINVFNDGVAQIALDQVCLVIGQKVYFHGGTTCTIQSDKLEEFNAAFLKFKQHQCYK